MTSVREQLFWKFLASTHAREQSSEQPRLTPDSKLPSAALLGLYGHWLGRPQTGACPGCTCSPWVTISEAELKMAETLLCKTGSDRLSKQSSGSPRTRLSVTCSWDGRGWGFCTSAPFYTAMNTPCIQLSKPLTHVGKR